MGELQHQQLFPFGITKSIENAQSPLPDTERTMSMSMHRRFPLEQERMIS